jgi:uncharacterized protein YndB with AHSA1/START domain
MGEQVAVSKDVAAPAELVWAMVTDVRRMGEWSPETTAGQWLKGATGPVPGAKFKGTNKNGEKSWSTDATVVDAEPGTRFAFNVDVGPVKVASWSYDFEPTADGCRVTETWTDRRNALIKALGKPLSGVADRAAHNRQGMVETLERLAAAAESQAAATS